jgi:hypothetical protein
MNNEQVPASASAAAEPSLVRFTEALTGNPDAKQADGIADMLLIFLSAGGTILGVFVAAILYFYITAAQAHSISWMFMLLVCVGAGGVLGCLAVMAILNAKDLIEWETVR